VVAHNVDKKALRGHGIFGYKGLVPVHIVLARHLSSLCTVAASQYQAMQKRIQKKGSRKSLLHSYQGLLPLVCFALFFGTDSLILELAKESSLPFSLIGRIFGSFVVLRNHARAIMAIEGVTTGLGAWGIL
jgi:hypothetical protein